MPVKRKWLNKVSSYNNGTIQWGLDKLKDEYPSVTLSIRDCSRAVSLDLCFYGEKSRVKQLRKLRIMQDALADLESQIKAFEFKKKKKNRKKKAKKVDAVIQSILGIDTNNPEPEAQTTTETT